MQENDHSRDIYLTKSIGRVKMTEIEITVHNKTDIRTQAQIFINQTLVCTRMADPGTSCTLSAASGRYDIYFKHGITGWELAHKLDSEGNTVTLSQRKGRYIISLN